MTCHHLPLDGSRVKALLFRSTKGIISIKTGFECAKNDLFMWISEIIVFVYHDPSHKNVYFFFFCKLVVIYKYTASAGTSGQFFFVMLGSCNDGHSNPDINVQQ